MKTLRCRFCGDECDASNRDVLSGWTHNHPSVCPYRQDRVPSLNGVHVGDEWVNIHTGNRSVVTEIRLGGAGVYTDREPIVVFDSERGGMGGWPLWSLVEHHDPLTRPGEYPVPWRRHRGSRWALVAWRTSGYRGRRKNRKYAYYHAYHTVSDLTIDWSKTNVLWQTDPQTERVQKQYANARAEAQALMDSGDELLAKVGAQMAETFAEVA